MSMPAGLALIPIFPATHYPLQPLSKNIVGRGGEPAGTCSITHELRKTRHCRAAPSGYAPDTDLADAASWPLSAGISCGARAGEELSRSLLYARAGGRGDAAADPALSARRRHHLLGHPGGPACPGSGGDVRGGAGASVGASPLCRRGAEVIVGPTGGDAGAVRCGDLRRAAG